MPSPNLPPQFVCALLLVIFFVRLARREEGSPNRVFLAMIAVYALQSTLHGLRWGYGIEVYRPLQPILASIIPPLTWVGFTSFTTGHRRRLWLHALPPVAVVLLLFAPRVFLDPALFLIVAGYGVALVLLARSGPDALDRVELDGAITVYRAVLVSGINLIVSALVDVAIAYDFVRNGGAHAAWIAGLTGVVYIAVLGWAAVVAGGSAPARTEDAPARLPTVRAPAETEAEDGQVIAALDALMNATHLYRDPELSLDRIARRMVLPARRISGAVNRIRALNVSQYVNEHRIAEACARLKDSDAAVTQIMFEVGFQTKSNFNREFLRVTGKSPSVWRAEHRTAQVA